MAQQFFSFLQNISVCGSFSVAVKMTEVATYNIQKGLQYVKGIVLV